MMRLERLRELKSELEGLNRDASALLTFELEQREKEVADSETYGIVIAVRLSPPCPPFLSFLRGETRLMVWGMIGFGRGGC